MIRSLRSLRHPSSRTLIATAGGALLWTASANGLLAAGPHDRAELLLPPIFALAFASISALLRHDSRRWPLEGAFMGMAAALLGPIWAVGLAASCRFARWCVSGENGLPSQWGAEALAIALGGVAASFLAGPWMGMAFLAVWLAARRTPLVPGLATFGLGVIGIGMADALGPQWSAAMALPVVLLLMIASEEAHALRTKDEALHTLGVMLQMAHPYTHGHIARVARIAERAALRLGLGAHRAAMVHRAARLHDIGKIAIDEAILDKPGRLTAEEYAHVKLHAAFGAAILERSGEPSSLANWIRCHHERPDGAGYPRGLRGRQIPLEARIIAAADAFDAMTGGFREGERRPYRDPISPAEAIAELERGSGSQFDPRVVSAFRHAVAEEETL